MTNRKPKARHDEYRIAAFLTLEEAKSLNRAGQLMFQNFEHTLSGLDGLAAIDEANNFEDGAIFPCYIRVCRNKGYQAPEARKVNLVDGESAAATDAEELPTS